MFSLALLSWISLKMVLPILPGLADELHSSSSGIKLSVSIYLIFFAFSQLVWGAIIQKRGSRRTIYYSLIIASLGTLIAMASFNLPTYIIGRTLEGIGLGAIGPVTRTVMVNFFDRKELSVRFSIIIGTAATMPALTPILSGYLLYWTNWQAIFGAFFLMTAILFYLIYRLLPSDLHDNVNHEEMTTVKILKNYLTVLKQKAFWGYSLPYVAMSSGLLGYYSAMPYWYSVQLHIAEHRFAFVAVPTVSMYIFGLFVSGWLTKSKSIETIIIYGASFSVFTTFLLLILAFLNIDTMISIIIAMSLFGFSASLISPNANAGVLMHFKKLAAPTSVLVSTTLFGVASLTSAVTMNINISETLWTLAAYLGTLSAIALLASYFWMWVPIMKRGDITAPTQSHKF